MKPGPPGGRRSLRGRAKGVALTGHGPHRGVVVSARLQRVARQIGGFFCFEAIKYRSNGWFDPFPSPLRLDPVLPNGLIKLPKPRRILSVLRAYRQRIPST